MIGEGCTKHEDLIPKFLLNWFFRSEKNLYKKNTMKKKFCKPFHYFFSFSLQVTQMMLKRSRFDLALDFSSFLSDFSGICWNQWIVQNSHYAKELCVFSGIAIHAILVTNRIQLRQNSLLNSDCTFSFCRARTPTSFNDL